MSSKTDPDATRITQQYRDREHRMVYELRCGPEALVLRASQQTPDASAEWRFEAHPMQTPQLLVVGAWGATRTDAFHAVRDVWLEKGPSMGLATVDWDKVATALTAVRAI